MNPVEVRQVDGIPLVVLHDHRAFKRGAELAEAIMTQLNSGDVPQATLEQIAVALAAAVGHRTFGESKPEMRQMQEVIAPKEGEDATDVLKRVTQFAEMFRAQAAHKPKPSVTQGSGTSVALGAVRGVMVGATGSGDAWKPGEGARQMVKGVMAHYPDKGHPIRRMWEALGAKVRERSRG